MQRYGFVDILGGLHERQVMAFVILMVALALRIVALELVADDRCAHRRQCQDARRTLHIRGAVVRPKRSVQDVSEGIAHFIYSLGEMEPVHIGLVKRDDVLWSRENEQGRVSSLCDAAGHLVAGI